MVRFPSSVLCLTVLSTLTPSVSTFQTPSRSHASTGLHAQKQDLDLHALGKSAAAVMVAVVLSTSPVYADEYGRETEADTLFTGETTLICTKRGILGACVKTERRTADNDNDKSDKYFQEPTELVKRKDLQAREAEETEGNALIAKLRLQSEANREKNDLAVQLRTQLNDQSASFGPFDGQTVILNVDGKGFTLLANPQAMRLKNQGLIKDKQFIRQPTKEDLDAALVSEPNVFQRFFGSAEE